MGKTFLFIESVAGPLIVSVIFLAIFFLLHLILRRKYKEDHHKTLPSQLLFFSITIIGLVCFILVLPVSDALRVQILSLLGILLSGALALSSTTLLGNALAGLMMRGTRSFRLGNFIKIKEYFGRVSEIGLFHVEIQTEDRNLVTLPNMTIITNPLKVFQPSGTIVMTEVSLGYDIPHEKVKRLLIEAALKAGLEDPFAYIIELKDFSILYKISGLLTEPEKIISTRSNLNEEVMIALHEASIEIVSPVFENARNVQSQIFIPPKEAETDQEKAEPPPEETVFDKADQAGKLELKKEALAESEQLISELKDLKKEMITDSARKKLDMKVIELEKKIVEMSAEIKTLSEKLENEEI